MRLSRRLSTALALTLLSAPVAGVLAVTAGPANAAGVADLRINEVESNGTNMGPDWIEITNIGTASVDAGGLILKDDNNNNSLTIPANTQVTPGGFFAINTTPSFSLGNGDAARLFQSDGTTLIDGYTFAAHAANTWGRCVDGTGAFGNTLAPTKGAANACPGGNGIIPTLKLNEIESDGIGNVDWVEIVNTSSSAAANAGNVLLKDSDPTNVQAIPFGTSIPPSGRIAIDVTEFGLGGDDAVNLFASDGTTSLDSYTWAGAAATTYGRCPDITGAFTTTKTQTKNVPNLCATPVTTVPWPGGAAVATVDAANAFGSDVSGLAYEGTGSATRGVLWAVANGEGRMFRLLWDGSKWTPDTANGWTSGKLMKYPGGGGQPDSEGVTLTSAGSAGGLYVSTERDGLDGSVSKMSVLRYAVSGATPTLTASDEWDLTSKLPATSANGGLEAIGWVPDTYLTGHAFLDATTGVAYNPASYAGHGTGLFLVAEETTGEISAFALTPGGTSTRIATFQAGLLAVMDLQFEPETQQLWGACDNTCAGSVGRYAITNGVFAPVQFVARPTGMPDYNNEGFTISPAASCVGGTRPVWWSDDANDAGHVIREGTITCSPVAPADTTAPVVTITGVTAGATYLGVPPTATCTALDAVSGVRPCTVVQTSSGVTATAKDAAGNTGTASFAYMTLLSFIDKSTPIGGKFPVKRGKKITVVTYVASGTPKLLLPGGKAGPKLKRAGTAGALTIFKAKVKIPASFKGKSYTVTIKTAAGKQKVKIKLTGKP